MIKVGILGAGGISDWYVQIFNEEQNLGAKLLKFVILILQEQVAQQKKLALLQQPPMKIY